MNTIKNKCVGTVLVVRLRVTMHWDKWSENLTDLMTKEMEDPVGVVNFQEWQEVYP